MTVYLGGQQRYDTRYLIYCKMNLFQLLLIKSNTSAYCAFVIQAIHSNAKIHFRLKGAQARTDARSDHAVLELWVTFLSRKE